MEELIKKYPMILSIQMISETSFAPMIIKLKNSEDILLEVENHILLAETIEEESIEKEILTHKIFQSEKKLKKILK